MLGLGRSMGGAYDRGVHGGGSEPAPESAADMREYNAGPPQCISNGAAHKGAGPCHSMAGNKAACTDSADKHQ